MDDVAAVAERLGGLRVQARERIAQLSAEISEITAARADANLDDEHDPEGATVGFERAQLSSLLESARHQLDEIDAAIARVEAGIYGRCLDCGTRIDAERLDARPAAARCRACA